MLSIVCIEASRFQNSILNKSFNIQINKPTYFIGRGQQLQEKLSIKCGIIYLTTFDNTLSRVHASINFSPAWFTKNSNKTPQYLNLIMLQKQKLPPEVVQKIWQFIKPQKECILKDLKSKVGIFSKIVCQEIKSQMIIEFVHQSFIKFEYFEQYQTFEELQAKIKFYQECSDHKRIFYGNLPKIKLHYDNQNVERKRLELLKIWHLSVREIKYIILMEQNLILRIGRSSNCEIQIKDTAISRYQAYLKCQNRKWKIFDGNQIEKSKNGTWKRQKNIWIDVSKNQGNLIKNHIKIGTIKCEIQVLEQFQWLNIQKIANGDISNSFIEIGMDSIAEEVIEEKRQTLKSQN